MLDCLKFELLNVFKQLFNFERNEKFGGRGDVWNFLSSKQIARQFLLLSVEITSKTLKKNIYIFIQCF